MKAKNIILVIVIIALLCVFGYSAYNLYSIQHEYKENEEIYSSITDEYTSQNPSGAEYASEGSNGLPLTIDFDRLKELNPEVIGWMYCEDTVFNYPITQGTDNQFYLHHAFDGTPNGAGAIYVDFNNLPEFKDYTNIIYGHHMKNGSMFHDLDYYKDQKFYEDHSEMWLFTPTQNYKIQIFSVFTTPATSTDTYCIFRSPEPSYQDYLDYALEHAEINPIYTPTTQDHVVIFSTCSSNYDEARLVVYGILKPIEVNN